MSTHTVRAGIRVLSVVVVALAVVGIGYPVAAQQGGGPSVSLAGTQIQVEAGQPTSVTAEYELQVSSVGSGEGALGAFTGSMWKIPGRSVQAVSATVNGEEVSPTVEEGADHVDVSVPAGDVSDGDTVSLVLSYQVDGPQGELKVPLFVPDYPTSGTERVVGMTVVLPEGQQPQGDVFPRTSSVDGNRVEFDLLHAPGMVKMGYGSGSGSPLTPSAVFTVVGLILINVVFWGWAVRNYRYYSAEAEAEGEVA